MKKVFIVAGGISRFRKSRKEANFQLMVKECFDYLLSDICLSNEKAIDLIDGTVSSYFSDEFQRQLMASVMAQDFIGLCPKPGHRVEGGGASGGICIQEAYKAIASGYMDICLAFGFKTMSHLNTWKGNDIIARASDMTFDYPVGGFYTAYYAMMAKRHMHEFGTTKKQMAMVSVKNHRNACYNPYAQKPGKLNISDVMKSEMVASPLSQLDICTMSDGAAALLLASEKGLKRIEEISRDKIHPVKIAGIGRGTDSMRLSDRQRNNILLFPHESEEDFLKHDYPGVQSCKAGRIAALEAYRNARIKNPSEELDFVELHDAFTSSEIQAYEDLGLCRYGEGGKFIESGTPFLQKIDYGIKLEQKGKLPVNPSGGLLACGHPIGATGIMQGVIAFWQLQKQIKKHFKDGTLQLKSPKKGAIHSHGGTGTYVTVTILENTEN